MNTIIHLSTVVTNSDRRKASPNGDPFGTFGPPELCTWRVGPDTCRFQTNDPRLARKLSQRSGAALTGWSVQGGYLRIFQERISPRSARKLVTRYLKANGRVNRSVTREIKATNARFSCLKRHRNRGNLPGGLREGETQNEAWGRLNENRRIQNRAPGRTAWLRPLAAVA